MLHVTFKGYTKWKETLTSAGRAPVKHSADPLGCSGQCSWLRGWRWRLAGSSAERQRRSCWSWRTRCVEEVEAAQVDPSQLGDNGEWYYYFTAISVLPLRFTRKWSLPSCPRTYRHIQGCWWSGQPGSHLQQSYKPEAWCGTSSLGLKWLGKRKYEKRWSRCMKYQSNFFLAWTLHTKPFYERLWESGCKFTRM